MAYVETLKTMQSTSRSELRATLRGGLVGVCLAYGLMSLSDTRFSGFAEGDRFLREVEEALESHVGDEEEEEEEASRALLEASIVCIIALLIFITIVFEEVKEKVEESASHNTKPIIKALFGEMTILGFLSACTFVIVKTPFPSYLSERIFGEEELLVEMFETVHFSIFFIMVCFVSQVLVLVKQSMKLEAKWEKMDHKCHDPPSDSDSKELQLFRSLAKEFVLERSVEPPFQPAEESQRVPDDFRFGRYLSICLGHNMAHVVHVNILSWGFFILLTFCFYELMLLLHNDLTVISWVWAGIGWIVLLLVLLFQRYIQKVTESFAAPTCSSEQTSMTPLEEHSLLGEGPLPAWCKIDLKHHLSVRSWLVKTISPETPNRQDILFMFDSYGPELHFLLLQVLFVFIGIYLALLFITFAPAMWGEYNDSLLLFTLYILLSATPVVVLHVISDDLLAETSLVGCIGTHCRRPNVIADVLRETKTAHIVRGFLVLDKMHRLAGEHPVASNGGTGSEELNAAEMKDVEKTFDTFDKSGDGSLSMDELERLMYAMGNPLTTEKLEIMLAELDKNQDGLVSKDEFLKWYGSRVLGHHDHLSIEQRAHALFHMFDKNGNGKISVGEFKATLDAFAIGFTVDEVGQLVRELDEDGNMMIGEKEFLELLEKYYPKELHGEQHQHE